MVAGLANTPGRPSKIEKATSERIFELREQGLSYRQIAETLDMDISMQAIYLHIKKASSDATAEA